MDSFMNFLNSLSAFLWGPTMLVLLVGTGLYLTLGLKFFTFRKMPAGFAGIWKGRNSHGEGEISSFNALMTALSGTIGTGNIAGVATAIFLGGPGALFWMWVTALVGMATKFSEILLAMYYRQRTPKGNFVGGAMYFIERGLGPKFKILSILFAIFCICACFGTGNMIQSNTVAESLAANFGVPTWISAVGLFAVAAIVILGGIQRIGYVAGKVVPLMALVYIIISLIVIVTYADRIADVFIYVVKDAFTPTAAQGGFAGATVMMAIRYGMSRGVFSNEAGLGTAPIAHATATNDCSMSQAILGMLDTFIDTIIVCSMTGFAILVTDLWRAPEALNGVALTTAAFNAALPFAGGKLVTVCLLFFAFTTVLGWCVYGERCAIFLFGDKALIPFRVVYVLAVPVGALVKLDLVWLIADCANAMMAIPNLIGVLLLSPLVFKLVKEYNATGKIHTFDDENK